MQSFTPSLKFTKVNFIILSIKKAIIPTFFCLFTVCLVIFSKSNMQAAKDGLTLWVTSVVPSLLPFFIATELLSYTNVVYAIGNILEPIMKPLFHIPGIGAYSLLMGIISGYPTGAKIATSLRENNLCSKEEAERMLAFTNNSGPLFILGTVGTSMFGNSTIGILLLITHILACLTVGFIFRFYKYTHYSKSFFSKISKNYNYKGNYKTSNISSNNNYKIRSNYTDKNYNNYKTKEQVNFSNLGEVLGNSIMSAINTVVMIGGFVVLFSVILSILRNSNFIDVFSKTLFPFFRLFGVKDIRFISSFLCGILELTNGIMQISAIPCKQISTNIILSAFLLGFGGFSILLQVYSIISKSDISINAYFLGKLLHGIIAAFYTFIFVTCFPIFNLDL